MATPMTAGAVAKALGVSRDKVRRMVGRGVLPKPLARMGSWNLFDAGDVAALKRVLKLEEKAKKVTKKKR